MDRFSCHVNIYLQSFVPNLPAPMDLNILQLYMKKIEAIGIFLILIFSLAATRLYRKTSMTDTLHYDEIIADVFKSFPQGMGFNTNLSSTVLPKKVILIGDSLIELSFDPLNSFPLGSALAHAFRRRADVLNRGLSGYSSKWMNSQFERIKFEISQLEPDQVFMFLILIGTNDSVLPGNPHHVELVSFKEKLSNLVLSLSKLCPSSAILLVTPPPCSLAMINAPDSKLSKSGKARSYGAVKKYALAVQNIVRDLDMPLVKLIDLFSTLVLQDSEVEAFLSDGVHLNGQGYKVLFIELFSVLESLKDNLLPLPMIEPHFSKKVSEEVQDQTV